ILISEVQLAGAANAARCSLAVTNFRSGRTSCILPADPRSTALLRSFRWISSSRIYLNHKSFRVEEYRDQVIQRTNGRWGAPRPASRDSLPAIRLTVRESLN